MSNLVLPFAEALTIVLAHATSLSAPSTEQISLDEADHRILAAPVIAPRDQPPFDRSTRDGFAVRAADIRGPLKVIGQLRAGESWQKPPLAANEAIEIMTGAPVPAGADAVVMVEHASLIGNTLTIDPSRTLRSGDNIVPRGAEAQAGATVLPVGRALQAAEIAVAASCGAAALGVFRRPTVAILATGDELVELDAPSQLAPAEIYNSNSYALASLVRATGAQPTRLPIARDNRDDLDTRLAAATGHNLLLLSGGVSMGKYDLVEEALAANGAEFFFTGALIQPGKPIVFGKLVNGPYFFGLPGNPVSTQVCFHLFVAPLLRALAGRTDLAPIFVEARLEHDAPSGPKVLRFLPAELTGTHDSVTARLVGWQGSGDVSANARGNCYCVLPIGQDLKAGDTVRVLLR
jgi:molybdopterin molybdotransferase